MEKYVWLFPILFILHDFEEIIGFGVWGQKHLSTIENRFPKLAPQYKKFFSSYSTEGMAIAVLEIFALCTTISTLSVLFGFYKLWLGTFIAFTLHLIIHIVQAIAWKGYIPAILTSVVILPVCIFIIINCFHALNYPTNIIIFWSILGIILIAINVKLAHTLMHWFTKRFFQ